MVTLSRGLQVKEIPAHVRPVKKSSTNVYG